MKSLLLLPFALIAALLPFGGEPVASETEDRADARQLPGEHDWVVDPVHSSVVFRVKHADAAWFFGTFDKISGELTLDPAKPAEGKVKLTIPVESVDTNNEKRDGHLKGPDFFSAKENPEITFESTSIAGEGHELQVTGKLSMAGETQEITIPVRHIGDGQFYGKRRGYLTEFTVQRSKFGMQYGLDDKVLGDDVTLTIGLELVKPGQ